MAGKPCRGDEWFFGQSRPSAITAVGRVKIELPKYRIRGICRIEYGLDGALTIDFKHSSLFGAYEEDALISYRDGGLSIVDRERNRWFGADSALAVLTRGVGFDLYPDDLLYALLLALPRCEEIRDPQVWEGGGRWRLAGDWRGRAIEIEGTDHHAVRRFSFCPNNRNDCYTIDYIYNGVSVYPKRIGMARNDGLERITFDIVECCGGASVAD
jgi:hypothetical protein